MFFGLFLLLSQVKHASAIVTSDTAGSHVVAPGETAFGIDTSGVARLDTATNGQAVFVPEQRTLTLAVCGLLAAIIALYTSGVRSVNNARPHASPE
jgi:hypothetical protein